MGPGGWVLDEMEPIAETREAIEEYGPFGHDEMLHQLITSSADVQRLVPTCLGMSVAVFRHDVVFTLVATDATISALDAVQYLTDGPCVAAVVDPAAPRGPQGFDHDGLLDEQQWWLFAKSTAEFGIGSTLTLPIVIEDRVEGSVNLYASNAGAFDGHHAEVAQLVGGWAAGAVTNADLEFSTLAAARAVPARQRDEVTVSRAATVYAHTMGIDPLRAREHIRVAARQAGASELSLAETILRTIQGDS